MDARWALPIATLLACNSGDSTKKQAGETAEPTKSEAKALAVEPGSAAKKATALPAGAIASLYEADLCTTIDATRMAKVLGLADGTVVKMRGGFVGTSKSCRYSWGSEDDELAINVSFPLNPQGHAADIKKSVETLRADGDYTPVELPGHAAFWQEEYSSLAYYPDAEHSLHFQLASGKLPSPQEAAKAIIMEFIAK